MISRLYVCPLQQGTPGTSIAQAASEAMGGCRVVRLFDSAEPWLAQPEASQVEAAKTVGDGDVVIDATLPQLPYGSDPVRFHTLAGPHMRALALGVLDASNLTKKQLTEAATVISRRFATVHLPLLGILAIDATELPEAPAVPMAAIPADRAADVHALAGDLSQLLESDLQAPVSPVAYQQMLVTRACSDKKTIVLPESEDERILAAAAKLRDLDAVNLILLGNPDKVAADAQAAGLDLAGIEVVDPADPERRERYAKELAVIREKKGMTYEKALTQLEDISYFATMMVQLGEADGMVSGAIHTTAETIRPALQIIKTAPGTSTVSGAFLMLFADRAYLFADCAVTIDPNAEQLADIAASSARTAKAFGIDPKVALISYSTLGSGSGPSVEKVEQATAIAREANPDVAIDGPLQFDAAVDRAVAAKKAPGSKVAGEATVFIFNHLDVGNCTYKAAQRMAGALAVGPILQGLKKPVNDLSRGALVDDIVNTVIITAVQAQG
ncbi:MAG: phosphate acetyltransferase [Actinomycetaceae bacterium]|nr:phosphate acetyltransferase [Actinomycetaceae bacterium]MDU0970668.1 phosphate acetyltransferase [Actinomycetaceae bacterium]